MRYDAEGENIVLACACVRILHRGDGAVVRKLQAALARVCVEYAIKRCGMDNERLLDQMKDDIAAREEAVMKELNG